MRKDEIIANQLKILANQDQIKQSQTKLDLLLASQETILANQKQIRELEAKLSSLLAEEARSADEYDPFGEMIGSSTVFQQALRDALNVAEAETTVLLRGETGTGKELLAYAIHTHSPRRHRPFVIVNCAALPASLIESELFGYEKGAFTGAAQRKAGRFELADGGTIFLDEIGEVPLETQGRFLRVIQTGIFERLGSTKSVRVKVRIVAATNQPLERLVSERKFRADLYYRLNVFPITLPPNQQTMLGNKEIILANQKTLLANQETIQANQAKLVVHGAHAFKVGGDFQRVDSLFDLGVFQQGRIEFVQDFAQADFTGDGKVDDNDLLFAVTLRSSKPTQSLTINNTDNNHFALFWQDDWRVSRNLTLNLAVRADYLHNFGTRFIIGRTIGVVNNPVVGGPDRVVNLESSVKTKYDGLLVSLEKRFANRYQFRASHTLSKAFNYANDDQIPFSNGPVNPNNIQLEYGPTPNDRRHYFTFSGAVELPYGFQLAPIVTLASGVPMDILLPDASSRIPLLQRNAGGRLFKTGADLNSFIQRLNTAGGVNGQPLPLVRDDARFNDSFGSFDLRLSKAFKFGEKARLEPIVEVFNLFNVTNILGVSNVNYSGFANVLIRDSGTPGSAGYLKSSSFGRPVTAAGGVFGSGGPRAFQLAVRFSF